MRTHRFVLTIVERWPPNLRATGLRGCSTAVTRRPSFVMIFGMHASSERLR